MKFNKYIFLALLASFFFSCSNDDEIDNNQQVSPVEVYDYDAFLSLSVRNTEVSTKALSTTNTPDRIQKLSLAVFSYTSGKLMAFKEISAKEKESLNRIMDVKVTSGTVKILLIANYDGIPESWYKPNPESTDAYGIGLTTLDNFLKNLEPTTLDKEKNGYLTMSSGVLTFNLRAGYNYVGCYQNVGAVTAEGKEGVELLGQDPYYNQYISKLKMYHTIARVQIGELALDPKPEYGDTLNGGQVKFLLDEIFVANVKSKSNVFAEEASGVVEYPTASDDNFWWCGNYADLEGTLKVGSAKKVDYLKYDFGAYDKYGKEPTGSDAVGQLFIDFPFFSDYLFSTSGRVDNRLNTEMHKPTEARYPSSIRYDGIASLPIGVFFYVYENNQLSQDANNHTLMILKGDYLYKKDRKSKWEEVNDCYYAVAINESGSYVLDNDDNVNHKYIKRNYQYILELNIKGPGTSSPFDKSLSANLSASVKIMPWNVVKIKEEVE